MEALRFVNVIRYIEPLREGGSLPAIVEADDGFMYVLKFRGAGQGVKALIAELIGGLIAKELGLKMPEMVLANLDESYGKTEPDEEIRDLLKFSTGLNLGIHYLSGSITYDPVVKKIDDLLASKIVWLDCFLLNVDRTAKNTNLLWWKNELWLIDHGASLYFHHSWNNWIELAKKPFSRVNDHVLLAQASELEKVNEDFSKTLTQERISEIVELIPEDWLLIDHPFLSISEHRAAYKEFLNTRMQHAHQFVKSAQDARATIL